MQRGACQENIALSIVTGIRDAISVLSMMAGIVPLPDAARAYSPARFFSPIPNRLLDHPLKLVYCKHPIRSVLSTMLSK
jgi:hypothetical protein